MKRKQAEHDRAKALQLIVAGSLADEFKRAGLARSTGYRVLRRMLGESIRDAKARLLAAELAQGTPLAAAFARVGVSRATGYRMLQRADMRRPAAVSATQKARVPGDDPLAGLLSLIAAAAPEISNATMRRLEAGLRMQFGGRRVYVRKAPPPQR